MRDWFSTLLPEWWLKIDPWHRAAIALFLLAAIGFVVNVPFVGLMLGVLAVLLFLVRTVTHYR